MPRASQHREIACRPLRRLVESALKPSTSRSAASLAALFILIATTLLVRAPAQDNNALINALIRKGILTQQEADDIRVDLAREEGELARVRPNGKSTDRLSVGMRMQMQHAYLDTDIRDEPDPPATSHGFLRRMYLTLNADIGKNWSTVFTYDFAGGTYDDAILQWKPTPDLGFDFGLRKVNVGYEERASSGNIKAIERSSITRYFVESNNGRRLGAASYRIGAFLDGKRKLSANYTLVYSAAATNPERTDTFSDAESSGDSGLNRVAWWGNVGLSGKLANGTWLAGVGAGFLPDQGGFGPASAGRGFDLGILSVHADVSHGRFGLMAEYLTAHVERGVSLTTDARPQGFHFQPSVLLTRNIEAVFRFAWLDSDHRGVSLSDAIRSAPAGGTMNTFVEWYAGANWYLRGNDLKLQLGAVYGKTRDTTSGVPASAEALGVRSQMQVQF